MMAELGPAQLKLVYNETHFEEEDENASRLKYRSEFVMEVLMKK